MRYDPIEPKLFTKNRNNFLCKMENNSIAIFHSNDLMPKNADQVMKFKQNSDLFYLSGIDQEETVLVIIKNIDKHEELLFLRETNETIKIWEGEKLTKENATKVSGVKKVIWNKEFKHSISKLVNKATTIYLNSNEHPRANIVVESRDARFKKWIQHRFPEKEYKKCSNILKHLMYLGNNPNSNSIVKVIVYNQLVSLDNWLAGKEEDAFNNFYRAQIDQFFENPEDFNISKPRRLPDGSPIGSYSCFY